jgi:hypothetical protein
VTAPEPPSQSGGVTAHVAGLARATAEVSPASDQGAAPAEPLRRPVGMLLARLATRAELELAAAMRRAHEAWEQADSLAVIDHALESDIAVMRRRLAAAAGPKTTLARRAVALEGLLAIDAAVALVRLFERRLAGLLRLRLRSVTPELLPEGRPFLDLGRALHEAAEAWR